MAHYPSHTLRLSTVQSGVTGGSSGASSMPVVPPLSAGVGGAGAVSANYNQTSKMLLKDAAAAPPHHHTSGVPPPSGSAANCPSYSSTSLPRPTQIVFPASAASSMNHHSHHNQQKQHPPPHQQQQQHHQLHHSHFHRHTQQQHQNAHHHHSHHQCGPPPPSSTNYFNQEVTLLATHSRQQQQPISNGTETQQHQQSGGAVRMRRHEDEPWYHGQITREQAEALLLAPPHSAAAATASPPLHSSAANKNSQSAAKDHNSHSNSASSSSASSASVQDGLFLIRESVNYPGDFTLCVHYQHTVQHYRIMHNTQDAARHRFTVDQEDFFESLASLVHFYSTDANGLVCRLERYKEKPLAVQPPPPSRLVATQHPPPAASAQLFPAHYAKLIETFRARKMLFERSQLQLSDKLGSGDFAQVCKAVLHTTHAKERELVVAAKNLHKTATFVSASTQQQSQQQNPLLDEAEMMCRLSHPNLLRLIGVVLPPPSPAASLSTAHQIYLLTEFAPLGALANYLRTRGKNGIRPIEQFRWALDVLEGMCELERLRLVHRDLAARNVLLVPLPHSAASVSANGTATTTTSANSSSSITQQQTVTPTDFMRAKISDFGMCVNLQATTNASANTTANSCSSPNRNSSCNNAVKSSTSPTLKVASNANTHSNVATVAAASSFGRLPVKWTAPEAAKHPPTLSSRSDVWSFGVLLWEIYTFGRMPYPGVSVNEVLYRIEFDNLRLPQPTDLEPGQLWPLMKSCWTLEPLARPTFAALLNTFKELQFNFTAEGS